MDNATEPYLYLSVVNHFLGRKSKRFFIPLPFLACDMQSPGNGMQPLHHLRNGPVGVGVALPVVQAVGEALGWCLCGTMARFIFHRAPAFSGQMDRLSMKPELATRHDPQTTHRPEKLASNPSDPRRQQRHTMHSPS
jgi:hypothetical protein